MLQTNPQTTGGFISKQFDYVDFNPSNKKHRAAFLEFKLTGRWPDNLRFNLDPLYVSVPTMINQKLLDYYFQRDRTLPIDLKNKYFEIEPTYPIGYMHSDVVTTNEVINELCSDIGQDQTTTEGCESGVQGV
jgi:hypothetical protein